MGRTRGSVLLDGQHANAAPRIELHPAGNQREDRVVPGQLDVLSWMETRPTLARDNLTGLDHLAAVSLETAELGIGVPTVARSSLSFFMCHLKISLS